MAGKAQPVRTFERIAGLYTCYHTDSHVQDNWTKWQLVSDGRNGQRHSVANSGGRDVRTADAER